MLSENVKAYRKFKGWTQDRLAREFRVSRDNIASYERGLAKPSLEFVCMICDDLKVSIHDILYTRIFTDVINETEEISSTDQPGPYKNAGADIMAMDIEIGDKIIMLREALGLTEDERDAWKRLADALQAKNEKLEQALQKNNAT